MDVFECIFGRRSCRRFKADAVAREDLERMIDAGRYVPTGYNKQAVRFAVIASPEKVAETFQFTGWLTGTPPEHEQPTAYIVVLSDSGLGVDGTGARCAAYAIMLAAHALGYGSCWHGRENNEEFKAFLGLPAQYEPHILISLGRSAETSEVHDPATEWKIRKDDAGVIHVPKRGREEVTVAVL